MDKEVTIRSCAYLENHIEKNILQFSALQKEGFWSRLKGFIGKNEQGAFVFERCSSIHTMCMKHAIDVAFLSKKGEVMKVILNLKPWSFASCLGAYTTIERLHSEEPWFSQNEFVVYDAPTNKTRKEGFIWQPSAS